MTDSRRLDAIGDYGLSVCRNDKYVVGGGWSSLWLCYFDIDQFVQAETIRDVIDLAIQAIELRQKNGIPDTGL